MTNVSIEKFYVKFGEYYEFLYDNYDRVAGYSEAVDAFDDFLSKHASFVVEFAKYRGHMTFGDATIDPISSDREAAAFMFALDALI